MSDKTLTSIRGATFPFVVQYLQDDQVTPVDLTGATAHLQIRDGSDAKRGTYALTIEVSTGTLSRTLTPTETRALPVGVLKWGVEIAMSGGVVDSIVTGEVWNSLQEAVK
jgi:hypothetical protein